MFGLSFQEFVIVGVIAILLFGKKLPDVAKNLGVKYREFRKGLSEIQSSFNVSDYSHRTSASYSSSTSTTTASSASASSCSEYDDHDEPTAPKFEPPPTEPQDHATTESGEHMPRG